MAERILLITPQFYGVENEIQSILLNQGYDVYWIENKNLAFDYHGTKSKFKLLRKVYFYIFSPPVRYLKKELKKLQDLRFDILFLINGFIICNYLFKKLRQRNPLIRSILYLWDSSSMYSWKKELKYFDRVFTFDPLDSKTLGIEYKPNFYIEKSGKQAFSQSYDLSFAGKFSLDRLIAIDRIIESVISSGVSFYVRVWAGKKMWFHNKVLYKFLKKININGKWIYNYIINFEAVNGLLKRDYIYTNNLGFQEMQRYMVSSNVILDLPFKYQAGYSHRLIGALANGKKIITSNLNIKNEFFFNPNQFRFIDYEKPVIDFNWVKDIEEFTIPEVFTNLELSLWLTSFLHDENSKY